MKKGMDKLICYLFCYYENRCGYWSLSDLVVSFDQCMLVCVFMLK